MIEMFEIGTFVVYGNTGICKIEDISTLDIPGASNNRLYYVMTSLKGNGNRDFLPVDNTRVVIREVISKEDANSLFDRVADIPEIQVDNDKQREEKYKEFSKRCDCECWISIIKTIESRKKERLAQGKKITATDDRYYRLAADQLCSELAFVLELEANVIEEKIKSAI